ncbi:MAG: hypothetical protein ACM3O3_09740 [Syntrophothermus sp.]
MKTLTKIMAILFITIIACMICCVIGYYCDTHIEKLRSASIIYGGICSLIGYLGSLVTDKIRTC